MKRLVLTVMAAFAAGAVSAQQREPSEISDTRDSDNAAAVDEDAAPAEDAAAPPPNTAPDPKALQEKLKARAKRIPASGLAAALHQAEATAKQRATPLPRKPDLAAVIDELKRTQTADQDRQTPIDRITETATAVIRRPPPPPGLRALTSAEELPNVDAAEVDRVLIPVLVPAHPDVRDKIKVYGQENAYTATAVIDADATLSISGTCHRVIGGDPNIRNLHRRLAKSAPRLPGTGASYHISRNDYGVDISFSKFACGYVMTIECMDVDNDPRCAEDDYIIELADSMLLANPAIVEGE